VRAGTSTRSKNKGPLLFTSLSKTFTVTVVSSFIVAVSSLTIKVVETELIWEEGKQKGESKGREGSIKDGKVGRRGRIRDGKEERGG